MVLQLCDGHLISHQLATLLHQAIVTAVDVCDSVLYPAEDRTKYAVSRGFLKLKVTMGCHYLLGGPLPRAIKHQVLQWCVLNLNH